MSEVARSLFHTPLFPQRKLLAMRLTSITFCLGALVCGINLCQGQDLPADVPIAGAQTEELSATVEKIRSVPITDKSADDAWIYDGPVSWMGTDKTGTSLYLANYGVQDFVLKYLFTWDPKKKELPERVAQLDVFQGVFRMPHTAMWFEKEEGAIIQSLPEADHPSHPIRATEKLSDFIAGSEAGGFVVQRRPKGELWVWDLKTSKVRHVLKTETKVYAVAISHDGTRIACFGTPPIKGSAEDYPAIVHSSVLKVWDLTQPKFPTYKHNMGYHDSHAEFSPDDQQLLCLGGEGAFLPRGGRSRATVLQPTLPGWRREMDMRYHQMGACFLDEDRVAVGGLDGLVKILDMKQQEVLAEYDTEQEGVYSLRLHQGLLYSGGGDGTVCELKVTINDAAAK